MTRDIFLFRVTPLILSVNGLQMNYDEVQIKESIIKALSDLQVPVDKAREIAFHMTDWLSDLSAWQRFCEAPSSQSSDEVLDLLTKFLIHVPEHVAAANKLMNGFSIQDIFEVGVLTDESEKEVDKELDATMLRIKNIEDKALKKLRSRGGDDSDST